MIKEIHKQGTFYTFLRSNAHIFYVTTLWILTEKFSVQEGVQEELRCIVDRGHLLHHVPDDVTVVAIVMFRTRSKVRNIGTNKHIYLHISYNTYRFS